MPNGLGTTIIIPDAGSNFRDSVNVPLRPRTPDKIKFTCPVEEARFFTPVLDLQANVYVVTAITQTSRDIAVKEFENAMHDLNIEVKDDSALDIFRTNRAARQRADELNSNLKSPGHSQQDPVTNAIVIKPAVNQSMKL